MKKNWRISGETGQDGVAYDKLSTSASDHRSERWERTKYESLCRLNNKIKPEIALHLYCYYWSGENNWFLKLGPMKAELLWNAPEVTRFYDVVTEKEVEAINALGKNISQLATGNFHLFVHCKTDFFQVQDPYTGKLVNADYRISESAWLRGDGGTREDELVLNFRRRVGIITGLIKLFDTDAPVSYATRLLNPIINRDF